MHTPRLKKVKPLSAGKIIAPPSSVFVEFPEGITDTWLREQLRVTPAEVSAFEKSLASDFDEAILNTLFADARKRVVQSIVGPLGIGKFIALYDRVGGNVDTIHNARQKDENGKTQPIGTDAFQEQYDNRDPYDSHVYHSDPRYREKNADVSVQKDSGTLVDAGTGKQVSPKTSIDLDHTISAFEIHNDAGRILADLDASELANAPTNLNPINRSVNRSKQNKTMAQFITYLKKGRQKRQAKIADLKSKQELSDKERKQLEKLEALESVDVEVLEQLDKEARKEYDSKINKAYYTSSKFYLNLGKTSLTEGAKMGFQQALGLLCYDLCNGLFDEVLDSYRNGFVGGTEAKNWQSALEIRLKKVGEGIFADWKKLVRAFCEGNISGAISNVITTLINVFLTTAKNIVRIIREGTFVLFRAGKIILFPPQDMTIEDAWDTALKMLVEGAFVLGGITLEETIAKSLLTAPILTPIASTMSAIFAGIATGILSAIALYAIDKWDPFGARYVKKRRHIAQKIQDMHTASVENINALCRDCGIVWEV